MKKLKIDLSEKEFDEVQRDFEWMMKEGYSLYAMLYLICEKYRCNWSVAHEGNNVYLRIFRN